MGEIEECLLRKYINQADLTDVKDQEVLEPNEKHEEHGQTTSESEKADERAAEETTEETAENESESILNKDQDNREDESQEEDLFDPEAERAKCQELTDPVDRMICLEFLEEDLAEPMDDLDQVIISGPTTKADKTSDDKIVEENAEQEIEEISEEEWGLCKLLPSQNEIDHCIGGRKVVKRNRKDSSSNDQASQESGQDKSDTQPLVDCVNMDSAEAIDVCYDEELKIQEKLKTDEDESTDNGNQIVPGSVAIDAADTADIENCVNQGSFNKFTECLSQLKETNQGLETNDDSEVEQKKRDYLGVAVAIGIAFLTLAIPICIVVLCCKCRSERKNEKIQAISPVDAPTEQNRQETSPQTERALNFNTDPVPCEDLEQPAQQAITIQEEHDSFAEQKQKEIELKTAEKLRASIASHSELDGATDGGAS